MPIRHLALGLLAAGLWPTASLAQGSPEPLTGEALTSCADSLIEMRRESQRLLAADADHAPRREAINRQREALDDIADDQLWQAARQRHNAEAAAFNEEMARYERALAQINAVREDYERRCAGRSYRGSDFQRLSPAQQEAMQRGSGDIAVPFDGRPIGQR